MHHVLPFHHPWSQESDICNISWLTLYTISRPVIKIRLINITTSSVIIFNKTTSSISFLSFAKHQAKWSRIKSTEQFFPLLLTKCPQMNLHLEYWGDQIKIQSARWTIAYIAHFWLNFRFPPVYVGVKNVNVFSWCVKLTEDYFGLYNSLFGNLSALYYSIL